MIRKYLKKLKSISMVTMFMLLLFSCQKENRADLKKSGNSENIISLNDAKAIANSSPFDKPIVVSKTKMASKSLTESRMPAKQVSSIVPVPDDNGNTAFFIINYETGGFLILSGDKRTEPILAVSETNSFPLENTEDFPTGLVQWLFSSKEAIQEVRLNNIQPSEAVKNQWNLLISDTAIYSSRGDRPPIPETGDGCEGMDHIVTVKGPLLTTEWDQGCGFNEAFPAMSCSPSTPCGKAWTGCVATAMGQVMKYHEYPTSYSWANMPATYGTTTTSLFLKDIADAVDMEYLCDGSGADTQNDVASAFKNAFGYSSAVYDDYDYQVVKSELAQNRPVILRGGSNTGWWIFGQYTNGHAWVCDGYEDIDIPCYGGILRFHMNWGWGNNNYNGYYAVDNFNPGGTTFNYKTGMVYNIIP